MVKKNINTIIINSHSAIKTGDDNKNYKFNFNVAPIEIKSKAILKVANFCHFGTATNHTLNLYNFKIKGINIDTSKYQYNVNGEPIILSTTFDNTRSLYEENEITLVKQTINNIDIIPETVVTSAFISDVSITSNGSGYISSNYQLTATGGGGSGFSAIGVVSSNFNTFQNVIINTGGSGYTSKPTIGFVNVPTNGSNVIFNPILNYGTPTDGLANTLNFCMTLRIEEEENE
jgi:hypothetical protein